MTDIDAQLPLETGWLASTPPGDTYLRRFLLNWASMCAATARLQGGAVLETDTFRLADSGSPAAFANCATLLQPLRPETAAAELGGIAAFFGHVASPPPREVILVSAWPTGDLHAFDWNLMGHPPVHLLPAGAAPTTPPAELRIIPVRDLDALHAWERVAIAGYPLDGLAGAPPGTLMPANWLQESRSRLWVGYVDTEPVCAASAWTEFGINNVVLVATMPAARRRGYGEALTWCAALADPTLPAMLLSSDEGRPVYERMGFLPLQRFTLWYQSPH